MADNEGYTAHGGEAKKPLMVHVTAPATLQAGYTFEALLNDDPNHPFTCEVPEGGVLEGESFYAPLPESAMTAERIINAPTGRWKDGLCDCFSVGICHPSVWCAFCCGKIAMAQVMMRMQLTWLGEPGPRESTKNTFKVVLILFCSYIVYSTSLDIASADYTEATMPRSITALKAIGGTLFTVWSLYSLCRTRQSVRNQYSIPEERCVGCEDLCCALWCTCCTISQMARHTGEYETYPGVCCSKTGHPPGTPLTV